MGEVEWGMFFGREYSIEVNCSRFECSLSSQSRVDTNKSTMK